MKKPRGPRAGAATTTYHISPKGNDKAGGSAARPLKTVGRALKKASGPGPVHIVLHPGVYPPLSLRGVKGTPDRPVVIRGLKPIPIDFSVTAELDGRRMEWRPAREALDHGVLQLAGTEGLAIIDGSGGDGSELRDCTDLRLEHLVFYNGRTALAVRRCQRVTVANCVITGEPTRGVTGILFCVGGPSDQPSREVRLERLLIYNLKECGICVQPGALFDSVWESCIVHGMQSDGGDGFSFSHVVPVDRPGAHPNRVFPGGIDYRITLRRCLSMRNRLDGFDVGQGVGGVTLEMCLGDGNGWGEWHSKDLKMWSSNNRLIHSRMTGRTAFVKGANYMEGFLAGTFEARAGYGPESGKAFASGEQPSA